MAGTKINWCDKVWNPVRGCKQVSPGWNALTGRHTDMGRPCNDVAKLNWIIAGCESGPNARPMELDWARSLRDQCVEAGVPMLDGQLWMMKPGGAK